MEEKSGGAVGARPYNEEERKKAIKRYRNKRIKRNYNKRITYPCRKRQADGQHRARGRFARNENMEAAEIYHHILMQSHSYSDQHPPPESGSCEWMRQMQEWVRYKREKKLCYLDLKIFSNEVLLSDEHCKVLLSKVHGVK